MVLGFFLGQLLLFYNGKLYIRGPCSQLPCFFVNFIFCFVFFFLACAFYFNFP